MDDTETDDVVLLVFLCKSVTAKCLIAVDQKNRIKQARLDYLFGNVARAMNS